MIVVPAKQGQEATNLIPINQLLCTPLLQLLNRLEVKPALLGLRQGIYGCR